jgi:hypothetical protein
VREKHNFDKYKVDPLHMMPRVGLSYVRFACFLFCFGGRGASCRSEGSTLSFRFMHHTCTVF